MMWYSARPTNFPSDVMPIATGFVGVAVSEDGLRWQKVAGPEQDGSVLAPQTCDPSAFDATHVAVGDVALGDDGSSLVMHYFGGGNETPRGSTPLPRGVAMCIGKAVCVDGEGTRWERVAGPIIEPSPEELFVGWPQLVRRDLLFFHCARKTDSDLFALLRFTPI